MRILLSCLQDLRPHPIPAYRFWADYFRNGITEAGHDVTEVPGVDWAAGITPLASDERACWKSETWSRVLDFLASETKAGRRIDMFLSYLYPEQIESAGLAEIRRLGVPCVNFFCDNVREFKRVPAEYRHFDLHWVPEFEALPMYRHAGLKHVHAPMPVCIAPADRQNAHEQNTEAVFIGSEDVLRRKLLAEAIRLGAPLTVRGPGWAPGNAAPSLRTERGSLSGVLRNQVEFLRKRGTVEWMRKTARRVWPGTTMPIAEDCLAPSVFGQEYVRCTKGSQVVIGVNRVPTFSRSVQNPLKYSRLRDIEAPMMGACYLTEWTEGLATLYDLGDEIETYRSADELVDKLKALQSNPAKRARLRHAGQRRALTDHTVARSLRKISDSFG